MNDVRTKAIKLLGDPYPGDRTDVLVVAGQFLAEHPADDDVPVTVEWLNKLDNADGTGMGMLRVRLMEDRTIRLMSPCLKPNEGIEGLGDWIASRQATRGDVRRLCKSLGIEVTA